MFDGSSSLINTATSYASAAGGLVVLSTIFWMWVKSRLSQTNKDVTTDKAEVEMISVLQKENSELRFRVSEAEKHYNSAVARLAIMDQQQQKIDELQTLVNEFSKKLELASALIQNLSVENATLSTHIRHIEEQNITLKEQFEVIEKQNSKMFDIISSMESSK
jgi:DNA repair exonuclease SbcCD ATPase subunit